MTLTYKKKDINFQDSILLLNNSLRTLSHDFEVETVKGHFPHNWITQEKLDYIGPKPDITSFPDISIKEYQEILEPYNLKVECLKYLEADCVSLYQVLNKFQADIFKLTKIDPLVSNTIASLSNKVWRYLDKKNLLNLRSIPMGAKIHGIIRKAYYGGICEVYAPHIKGGIKYDVNSLYPHIMNSVKFPVGSPIFSSQKDLNFYYGFCYAKINTAEVLIKGLLPYRFNNMLMTPLGKFEGWYYSEELKLAEKLGYKIEVLYGIHWKQRSSIFTNFYNVFAKLKMESTGSIRAIAKLILNSNYGFLGLSEDISKSEIIKKSDAVKDNSEQNIETLNEELCIQTRELREDEETNVDKDYLDTINIAVAAIIAAEARMFMLQYRLDSKTAYTDTDSIIASGTEPLDNMSIDPTKLGSFKIEEAFKEFTAIKKKITADPEGVN